MGRTKALIGIAIVVGVAIVAGAGFLRYWNRAKSDNVVITFPQDMAKMAEKSFSDVPSSGLADDWVDCVENFVSRADANATRVECRSWSVQGVRVSMVALRTKVGLVPVLESRAEDYASNGITLVDVVGGPGGAPFALDEMHSREWVKKMRKTFGPAQGQEGFRFNARLVEEIAYFQALKRGFTIASIGYWGTNVRTLKEPDEFQLAASDVRAAINHYRDASGAEPPIFATSLGTHLTLAAIGAQRLETMHVFANVPVMTGLQSHLRRITKIRQQRLAEGKDVGGWSTFNVYERSKEGFVFEYKKMLPLHEYITAFTGDADYPWEDFNPTSPCSRIVLGLDDPRTKDYFEQTPSWSSEGYIIAVTADHDIEREVPEIMRDQVAFFSDCVLREGPV